MDINQALKFVVLALFYGRHAVAPDGDGNATTLANAARDLLQSAGLDPDDLPDEFVPEGMDVPTYSYVCTQIVKERQLDDPEHGLIGSDDDGEVFAEDIELTATTLADLFAAIGKGYGLEIEEVSLPVDHNVEDVTEIEFYRDETPGGDPATKDDRERWKRGEIKMYYACYRFTVAKRAPITLSEIEASGINVDMP
jgi:hypothetical protein